ncbi:MAG TPA: 4-hydroxythreonine-4-phosphate dehydrogenase PdxA [Bacteroidetes bacterium]|nr:4-hydroxythreonine-4-phosphate dehydrogenase PdxA [Bacteroidota bacterium]
MQNSIVITVGDMNGIGPELILKCLTATDQVDTRFILAGPASVFQYYATLFEIPFNLDVIHSPSTIPNLGNCIFDPFETEYHPNPGKISTEAGEIAMKSLDFGVSLVKDELAQALVTAPISKESIQMAGYNYAGHTEFLAEKTSCPEYTMMLISGGLRVGLVTTHIPVRQIAESITQEAIITKARIIHTTLKTQFSIKKPKIAILGLNPHAGDGGVIGVEEIEVIEPAMMSLNQMGVECDGPYPADGFFGSQQFENFDAVLAMYHDQGLGPFKALSFGRGVNFTAGLPIIRTSPDHGTAFAIAGKNRASMDSMLEAINLAKKLTYNLST